MLDEASNHGYPNVEKPSESGEVGAGILNITDNYLPKHTFQGNLNAALSIIMIALVVVVFIESIRKIYTIRFGKG